ncbi:MAG: ABC transporter permease [Actinobacteria bacterium]|nr:ABC transporter permease [Actinomycetota bacterium]
MSSAALTAVGNVRVTQARVFVSEWTKLRSLRSTMWSLFAAVVLGIGLPCLFAAVTSSHWNHMSPHEQANRHPLDIALAGVNIAQLAIGVLGVLVISGEYSTGMIRATMSAVPRRLPVLWAKAADFALVTFVLMLPTVLIAFFASQSIVDHIPQLKTSLSASGVFRAELGGALYLTVLGVMCLALGAIVRNTAGGIALFAGIFFVIPPLMNILPSSWNNAISPYLPDAAGRDVFSLTTGSHDLGHWAGFALFCGYTVLALAIAGVLLKRRDV